MQVQLINVTLAESFNFLANTKYYKIVGDNIDKNFRRSYQRSDFQTRSYHFFHAYAVLERINLSGLSDLPPSGVMKLTLLTPNDDDIKMLKDSFVVFISR